MIHFVCWKWRSAYRETFTAEHVNTLDVMLAKHCSLAHKLICITDDSQGVGCDVIFPLWDDFADLLNPYDTGDGAFPSCYRRLRLFDPSTQELMGIRGGDQVVSIDLDVVIVRDLAPLLNRHAEQEFTGWKVFGGMAWPQPWYLQGSFFRFRAGALTELWRDFDPIRSPAQTKAAGYFGSDQAWLSYKLMGRYPTWGGADGIISFLTNLCEIRGNRGALPPSARIVCFNGPQKPWHADVQEQWPWIAHHYKPVAQAGAVV